MNVPIQARPVYRTQNVRAINGVSPSGDCGTGYWCCQGPTGGPFCQKCVTNWLGICLDPSVVTCALALAIPAHNC
jgi:hypothetical protein